MKSNILPYARGTIKAPIDDTDDENDHNNYEDDHHRRFASVSMLAWVGRGLIMALFHMLPHSWASSDLSFIFLRSLLLIGTMFFLVYLVLAFPLPRHACKHLLGYQHPSSLHAQTISVCLCVAPQFGIPCLSLSSSNDLASFELTLHIHLIIILSALEILVISSTLKS